MRAVRLSGGDTNTAKEPSSTATECILETVTEKPIDMFDATFSHASLPMFTTIL